MSNPNEATVEMGGDVAPTEESALLGDSSSSPNGSDTSEKSERLWEEMNHPWPSTYERSISLLASPVIRKKQVDICTMSPKPGSTPAALQRRRNLDRGYHTPDHHAVIPPLFGRREHLSDREGDFQKMSVRKNQSLDFGLQSVQQVQTEQQRRAKEAEEYRAKILKQTKAEEKALAGKKMPVELEKPEAADATATFAQCVFNLGNILMGVGLLGLPFVFKSAGWFGGFFCLSTFGFITWRTSILIGREMNGDPRPLHYFDDSVSKSQPLAPLGSFAGGRMLQQVTSFPDIARSAFGEKGCLILAVVLYFELFSCISVFFVTIGDHLHQLFPSVSSSIHATLVAGVSTIPTVLLRTPTLLSYLSMVGTIATIAVVLSVFFAAVFEGDMTDQIAQREGVVDASPYHTEWRTPGLTLAFGLVAYCFSGHAIVPSIFTSMARPQEFERMVSFTFLAVIACCLVVAVSGYYMFGSLVKDQVTLSMEESSQAPIAMKMLIWLMIMTAFSKITLTMFPLALGMEEIVAPYLTSEKMVDAAASVIKLGLTAAALVVSIYVPSFSFLCSLVGMICTMSVSVIFPAAAHLAMFGPKLDFAEKALDFAFVILGAVMAVVGTIATL